MSARILAVDPGLGGALALLTTLGELTVDDMPTLEIRRGGKLKRIINAAAFADRIRDLAPTHAVIERVGAMPGQGVTSMFSFGRSVGVIEGVLAALRVPVTYEAPQIWQLALSIPSGKDGSRLRASQLLPACAERWRRKCDDGRSDAALIGLWGLLNLATIESARNVADKGAA